MSVRICMCVCMHAHVSVCLFACMICVYCVCYLSGCYYGIVMRGHTLSTLKFPLIRKHGQELLTELSKAAGKPVCVDVSLCVLARVPYS